MKIVKILFLIPIFLPLLVCGFAHDKATGLPKINLDMPVYDFNEVKQGQVIVHDFIVENQGDAVLEIKGVKPG